MKNEDVPKESTTIERKENWVGDIWTKNFAIYLKIINITNLT